MLRAGVGIGLLDRGRFSLGPLVVKQFLALLIDYLGMGWLLMRAVVLLMLGMQMGLGWLLGCLLKLLKGLVLLLSTGERLGCWWTLLLRRLGTWKRWRRVPVCWRSDSALMRCENG